jgi:hypothetical protein
MSNNEKGAGAGGAHPRGGTTTPPTVSETTAPTARARDHTEASVLHAADLFRLGDGLFLHSVRGRTKAKADCV